jgi:hypothetical protein
MKLIHDPHQQIQTQTEVQAAHEKPTKIALKRHENPTSYKWRIDATMKAFIHSEVRFFTNRGKSKPMEQGNEKQSGWMDCLYGWWGPRGTHVSQKP